MGDIVNLEDEGPKLKVKVARRINGYHFGFANGINVDASRIAEKSNVTSAELLITSTIPGTPPHIYHDRLNLTSAQSKKTLRQELERRLEAEYWFDILETICTKTLELHRQGEPIHTISSQDEVDPPEFLLSPLLLRGHPNILYGLGGTGKSRLALAFGLMCLLPMAYQTLGLTTLKESTKVMYLDWETDRATFAWRLKTLCKGFSLDYIEMQYRRCYQTLHDDIEYIAEACAANDIGLVIVDSLGLASGGNLNDAEPAIKFHSALRKLNVTSLILAHTAKNPLTKQTSTFGSGFFEFIARVVWETKAAPEPKPGVIDVGLIHKKGNESEKFDPLGFSICFEKDAVRVKRSEIRFDSMLAESLSQSRRVQQALVELGQMTIQEIAEATEIPKKAVSEELTRLKRKNRVVSFPEHRWGLGASEGLINTL